MAAHHEQVYVPPPNADQSGSSWHGGGGGGGGLGGSGGGAGDGGEGGSGGWGGGGLDRAPRALKGDPRSWRMSQCDETLWDLKMRTGLREEVGTARAMRT